MLTDEDAAMMITSVRTPQPWEVADDWAAVVASVVTERTHRHVMAPREARALLLVAGRLLDTGVPIEVVLGRLMAKG